ncbi:MAG TPA: hypothetical protein VIB07_00815 [Nitrososphaera sp.]|jgi:hypothetical protein
MASPDSISNKVFRELVANSLFTEKQISIISKRLQGAPRPENMTSGAYYRQVGQCRDKVYALLYSMILLQSTGVIQPEGLVTLSRLGEQIGVIFASQARDVARDVVTLERITDITSVLNQLVKRLSNL